jgi:hypothetical protein
MVLFLALLPFVGPDLHAQTETALPLIQTDGAVYGRRCGIAGAEPSYRSNIEELIAGRNTAIIGLWLVSEDPAIRAYAAEGLIRLHRSGTTVPAEHLQVAHQLLRSKEMVRTCSGCLFGQMEMAEALQAMLRLSH